MEFFGPFARRVLILQILVSIFSSATSNPYDLESLLEYPCIANFVGGNLQIQPAADNLHGFENIAAKCTSLDVRIQNEDLDTDINWEAARYTFPRLRKYVVLFHTNCQHAENLLVGNGTLKKYLLFELTNGPWKLEQIWSLGVSINIKINDHVLLNIDHTNQSFKFAPKYGLDPNPIVDSLGHSTTLKSLALYNADITHELDFDPSYLEDIFYYWVTIPGAIQFLSKCTRLQKFTGPLFGHLDLNLDLVSKELREITVFDPTIYCSPPRSPSDVNHVMTEMHLSKSILDSSVAKNLWKVFPNIRKMSVTPTEDLGSRPNPELLRNLLRGLVHLEWIQMTLFDWEASSSGDRWEMERFLKESDLQGNETDFILEKRKYDNYWKGTVVQS